jgi:hypothetical protein
MVAFWPMCGHRYDGQLMVIGRAVNGWEGSFSKESLAAEEVRRRVLTDARDVSENGVPEWRANGRCPMLWVSDQWNDPRGGGYTTSRSRLWVLVRELTLTLGIAGSPPASWPSSVCWTNLYKVAPKAGGNPTTSMLNAQRSSAIKLLARELDEYRPRIVVVATGKDWYAPFVSALDLRPSDAVGPAVEGVACQGGRIWVFAKPPTYMPPGVDVEGYRADIARAVARLADIA